MPSLVEEKSCARSFTMFQRPDRTSQDSFELVNDAVTFRFLDTTHFHITIAANDVWRIPPHWHAESSSSSCNKVTCLKGTLFVNEASPPLSFSGSMYIPPGESYQLRLGEHHEFGSLRDEGELQFLTETTKLQTALWRNICGVTLDAQLYPRLSSTPY